MIVVVFIFVVLYNMFFECEKLFVFVGILMVLFFFSFNMMVVGSVMLCVIFDFGGFYFYVWVFIVYLLIIIVIIFIVGIFSDCYGCCLLILFGIVVFVLGSMGLGFV